MSGRSARPPEAEIWRRKKKLRCRSVFARFFWLFFGVVIQSNPWFSQGQVQRRYPTFVKYVNRESIIRKIYKICQICNPGVNYSTNLYMWVVGGRPWLVTVQIRFVLYINSFLFILILLVQVVLNCEYCFEFKLFVCNLWLVFAHEYIKFRFMQHITNFSISQSPSKNIFEDDY